MRSRIASLQKAVPVFAALGDDVRLSVVARLSAEGPLSITRLAEGSGVSRQALTKHLRVLEGAGLVRGERAGRENVFELRPHRLKEARRHIDAISGQWDETLGRLKAFVERAEG
jgi:DNA-binding transcriptional ArsR family regulator